MKTLVKIALALIPCSAFAQNSLVGDGFGGRLWYKPHNYSVGSYSGYTVCGDSGQLYSWGRNNYGQLGNGTYTGSDVPVKITGMNHVRFYTAGYLSAAIKTDGNGWIWGNGAETTPQKVIDNVFFADAGMDVVVFIKLDGTVWSLGNNTWGVFGNDTIGGNTLIPQQMLNIKNAVRVANGQFATFVLLKDGTVWASGINKNGCLGQALAAGEYSKTAVQVQGLKDIVDIKANTDAVIALDKNGNVFSWGGGNKGSIGNGTLLNQFTPYKITELNNIVAISGMNDGDHFLALDVARNVYGWGTNGKGQIGTDLPSPILTPIVVATNAADILAGENFSYILKADNSLWASGYSPLNSSIWMNLSNTKRYEFTEINPGISPMNLCKPVRIKSSSVTVKICAGDSVKIGNAYYKNEGTYIQYFKDPSGYDSTVFTQLILLQPTYGHKLAYKCKSASVVIENTVYSKAGLYTAHLKNHLGCDSVLDIEIRDFPESKSQINTTICENHEFYYNNVLYVEAGTYYQYLQNYRGCDSIITIDIHTLKSSLASQQVRICEGNVFTYNYHNYFKPGVYHDTFPNYRGCDSIMTTTLEVLPRPEADFMVQSQEIFMYDTVQFINQSSDADRYSWYFSENKNPVTEANPMHSFDISGDQSVLLVAENSASGCRDTSMINIAVKDITWFYIPDVFTPNSDGNNESFRTYFPPFYRSTLKIYSRWGEKLYEGSASEGWNGYYMDKPCQEGVYVYMLELQNSVTQKKFYREGTLILMRPKN